MLSSLKYRGNIVIHYHWQIENVFLIETIADSLYLSFGHFNRTLEQWHSNNYIFALKSLKSSILFLILSMYDTCACLINLHISFTRVLLEIQ